MRAYIKLNRKIVFSSEIFSKEKDSSFKFCVRTVLTQCTSSSQPWKAQHPLSERHFSAICYLRRLAVSRSVLSGDSTFTCLLYELPSSRDTRIVHLITYLYPSFINLKAILIYAFGHQLVRRGYDFN
ncbi:hypothetical protein AVEN_206588-1 [Araneus ventricosus]|uniref:Uncharacterized protein n=1 Tax=Araneus ventricosus TaxID=182803 RepID=A0A4Y2WQC2_ARAVE|nr:hypothetical protein AVEN_206588-1 [Araneus ventricosus]